MPESQHVVIWLNGLAQGLALGVVIGVGLFRGLVDPLLLRGYAWARCVWRERRRNGDR